MEMPNNHGEGRVYPKMWVHASVRKLAAAVLLLCTSACLHHASMSWIITCTPIATADALPVGISDKTRISAVHASKQIKRTIQEPKAAEADGAQRHGEPRQHVVSANIWDELEAAKKALHEAHMNPKDVRLKSGVKQAKNITRDTLQRRGSAGTPLLVVFTTAGCPYSEEALREALFAQPMIRNFGGSTTVATVATEKDPELVRLLGLTKLPRLHFYRDGHLESPDHQTYNGTEMVATEIAYWVLRQEAATVRYTAEGQQPMRQTADQGSPVGPVVYASVHKGSPRAELVEHLARNTDQLPSRFTLFNIQYVDPSNKEEFRVYRKQLPFDVGDEESLSLGEPTWEPRSIIALLLEAENRKVFFGEKPPPALSGARALLSVYVSRFENLQDIAMLLMEFQPKYQDRIAFHVANSTLRTAARSKAIFSHTWGGAVLTDRQGNASAYRKVAGVVREAIPFTQYSLSMPFNYHNLKAFFQEWESGKRELHFRSNIYSYSEKGSPVMELSHAQFVDILNTSERAPVSILYYEPDCSDCERFREAWRKTAQFFDEREALKSKVLFGQINGLLNDILDFDMRTKMPAIAVYPPGPRALDARVLYTGPPVAELLVAFLTRLTAKRDEL